MDPVILPRPQHPISRQLIDPDALKVMYRLLKSGYKAYLVGGGVRDLMLGRTPKDFDVSTDAHPNRIKRLFRNCRLVGRRFRLAHVHFGEKIIEVSTFRRRSEFQETNPDGDRLIRSDNTFGTPEEDAVRRDFTINSLFYDLETFSVIDFLGGIDDLNRRVVRCIGDPDVRLPEDPVRVIRAIKFSARLGFDIESTLWESMKQFAPEIHKCAKPRVLEEIYRLLREGASAQSFELLQNSGLLAELFPEVESYLSSQRKSNPDGDRIFWQYLEALDQLQAEGQTLSNSLLLSTLAVHLLGVAVGSEDPDEGQASNLSKDVDFLTREWVSRLGVARRDRERLAHMLRSQPRFVRPRGRRFRLRTFVTKHYYPDAEALFALGTQATGLELESLERWRSLRAEVGENVDSTPARKTRSKKKRGGRGRRSRKRRTAAS
ncbi:MAG: polynucleotide adenylyltransferase PcnB [Candidatus Eisenbacteria bacterium]|uniref:Poly(A) polymerase I n=1 Tax=Eiseniibacteriota bacterium TaxID=2212470 RepID=A0A7Y2EB95_UNCEI|nr:polynucleotide adenylyltransferase PcnB [Candidatus Eisenbacteria bacterium]